MWHIPSRARPDRLRSLLDAMVKHGSVEPGIVWLNEDGDRLDEYRSISLPPGWQFRFLEPGIHGCAEKLRRAFAEFPNEPWYGFIGDDIGIETDGFEQALIGAAGAWGIANGNDLARSRENVMEGRINGAEVFGGDLLRALGYWVPEGFIQLYIDDVWEVIGRSLGNWRTLMDVVTTHDFAPYLDPSKMDATCSRMNTPEMYAFGKKRFDEWAENEASDGINRAIAGIREAIGPRSVMIGTPCYADVSPHYAAALFETGMLLRNFGVVCEPKMIGGLATHVGRNAIADAFLKSPHTDLVFIDADMSWTPWDVVRLLTAQSPMIAGVGHKKGEKLADGTSPWCVKPLPKEGRDVSCTHMFEVDKVGTGFMLIHRSAFEYLAKGRPDLRRNGPDGSQYWRFFEWGDENGAEISEDYEFCRRWRAIGGKVMVDPHIRVKHYGAHAYGGDRTPDLREGHA